MCRLAHIENLFNNVSKLFLITDMSGIHINGILFKFNVRGMNVQLKPEGHTSVWFFFLKTKETQLGVFAKRTFQSYIDINTWTQSVSNHPSRSPNHPRPITHLHTFSDNGVYVALQLFLGI